VLVAAATAVARSDVEQAVGTEQQQPAVVVRLRVGHPQHESRRAGVGVVGVAPAELDDPLVAGRIGVVDVEQAAVAVVGRERNRQQAPLATRGDLRAQVEERRAQLAPVAQHHDPAGLLDDELAPPVAGRGGEEHGRVERADATQLHAAPGCGGAVARRPCLGPRRCRRR
jgi:hypothetical protein